MNVHIHIGENTKGLLGKTLGEINSSPVIKKKKKKKPQSLVSKILGSTIPFKPKYEVTTV